MVLSIPANPMRRRHILFKGTSPVMPDLCLSPESSILKAHIQDDLLDRGLMQTRPAYTSNAYGLCLLVYKCEISVILLFSPSLLHVLFLTHTWFFFMACCFFYLSITSLKIVYLRLLPDLCVLFVILCRCRHKMRGLRVGLCISVH